MDGMVQCERCKSGTFYIKINNQCLTCVHAKKAYRVEFRSTMIEECSIGGVGDQLGCTYYVCIKCGHHQFP